MDTDLSDNECTGNFDHLPARVLTTDARLFRKCKPTLHDLSEASRINRVTETPTAKRCKMSKRVTQVSSPHRMRWHQNRDLKTAIIPESEAQCTMMFHASRNIIDSSASCFQYFFSDNIVNKIVDETNKYAIQKGKPLFVTSAEVRTLCAILLLSGYVRLPNRRMYWSSDEDVFNRAVLLGMRRDRFDSIMANLHFADNFQMDNNDRFYKVRLLFNHFNDVSKVLPLTANLCVDESMIKYYGGHPAKQFIKGKPIKYGFKLWSLASPEGYLYQCEPYCGKDTKLKKNENGSAYDVVIGLAEKCNVPKGSRIYFDSYFTGFPLLEELSRRGIGGTGTMRTNRLRDCPLKTDTENIRERGDISFASRGSILACMWYDNKKVFMASNCDTVTPKVDALRWNDREKKRKTIQMPRWVYFLVVFISLLKGLFLISGL